MEKMKHEIIEGNVRRHIEVPRAKEKMGNCLLCNRPDQGAYAPSRKVEFLCSVCTMLLAGQSQELLKLMHDATDINRQKTALSMFIEGDEINEQKRPNTKSFLNGKRNNGVLRTKQRSIRKLKN